MKLVCKVLILMCYKVKEKLINIYMCIQCMYRKCQSNTKFYSYYWVFLCYLEYYMNKQILNKFHTKVWKYNMQMIWKHTSNYQSVPNFYTITELVYRWVYLYRFQIILFLMLFIYNLWIYKDTHHTTL